MEETLKNAKLHEWAPGNWTTVCPRSLDDTKPFMVGLLFEKREDAETFVAAMRRR